MSLSQKPGKAARLSIEQMSSFKELLNNIDNVEVILLLKKVSMYVVMFTICHYPSQMKGRVQEG